MMAIAPHCRWQVPNTLTANENVSIFRMTKEEGDKETKGTRKMIKPQQGSQEERL